MEMDEKKLISFFGSVPTPMELSTLGLFLGAPIQYRKNNSGLDEIAMQIPTAPGTFQPVIVTLGSDDCIAPGARLAIYHSCKLDEVAKGEGSPYKAIAQKFARVFDRLKNTDGYNSTFFDQKVASLREKLIKYYPEDMAAYDVAVKAFKDARDAELSDEKVAENVEAQNIAEQANVQDDDKKKEITK